MDWRPPGPEDPVHSRFIKDHANIIKTWHACGTECIDHCQETGELIMSGKKVHDEGSPRNRESVVGFFVGQTCPPHKKLERYGKPMP